MYDNGGARLFKRTCFAAPFFISLFYIHITCLDTDLQKQINNMPQFKATIATLPIGQCLLGLATAKSKSSSTYQSCTYGNLGIFNGVGKAPIQDVPSSLNGASLLKGVSVTNTGNGDNKRDAHSVYFSGKPDGLNTTDLSGCIVTFTNPSGDEFNGMNAKSEKCPDQMTQKCIDRLTARAKEVVAGGQSCAALTSQLKPESVADCDGLSKDLGEFTVTSLADLIPMTGSEVKYSLSNCWPEFPDRANLADITHSSVTLSALILPWVKIIDIDMSRAVNPTNKSTKSCTRSRPS